MVTMWPFVWTKYAVVSTKIDSGRYPISDYGEQGRSCITSILIWFIVGALCHFAYIFNMFNYLFFFYTIILGFFPLSLDEILKSSLRTTTTLSGSLVIWLLYIIVSLRYWIWKCCKKMVSKFSFIYLCIYDSQIWINCTQCTRIYVSFYFLNS